MPARRPFSRRPDPPPLEADEVRVVAVGTLAFAAGLVVVVLLRDRLAESGHGWLAWSCVTGIVLGLFGIVYTRRRRDSIARHTVPAERQASQPEPPVRRPQGPGDDRPRGSAPPP